MAQFKGSGTASITAGTNVVTCTGTFFLSGAAGLPIVKAGMDFMFADDVAPITILSVDSDTQLTLAANYPSDKTGAGFIITADYTNNRNYPLVGFGDLRQDAIISRLVRMLDLDVGTDKTMTATYRFAEGSMVASANPDPAQKKIPLCAASVKITRLSIVGCATLGTEGQTTTLVVSLDPCTTTPTAGRYVSITMDGGAAYADPAVCNLTVPAGAPVYMFFTTTAGHNNIEALMEVQKI